MTTSEKEVYDALTQAGLSMVQASGVMGNAENESDFDVEAAARDSNGLFSYGLIQWNAGSYPNANTLVTGDPSKDLANQVQYLIHDTHNSQAGLAGSTAAEVAGNWASKVEICQGCQPGGQQYNERVQNANNIYQQAKSGNWGSGSGISTTGKTSGPCSVLGIGNILSFLGICSTGPSITGGITSALGGDLKGWLERGALIIFGATLVVVGLIIMGVDFKRQSETPKPVRNQNAVQTPAQ